MSYSFSIVGDTPDQNSEWDIIQQLASIIQSNKGVISAMGNTQWHGVVDLEKIEKPTFNSMEVVPVVQPNNQEVTPVTTVPEPADLPPVEETNPTVPAPEVSTTVTADDEAKEVEPELNEAGEVVGFKEPTSTTTLPDIPSHSTSHDVLDPEGEIVGHEVTTDTPKEEA